MGQTADEAAVAYTILGLLEEDELAEWLRYEPTNSFDEQLRPWVEYALTQLVLLVGNDDVLFAQAISSDTAPFGRLVVFTAQLVIVAEIDNIEDNSSHPRTTSIPRRGIRSLAVSGGARIILNPEQSMNRQSVVKWPQQIELTIKYDNLAAPINISGPGMHRWDIRAKGPILELLAGLREDLVAVEASEGP